MTKKIHVIDLDPDLIPEDFKKMLKAFHDKAEKSTPKYRNCGCVGCYLKGMIEKNQEIFAEQEATTKAQDPVEGLAEAIRSGNPNRMAVAVNDLILHHLED